MRLENRARIRRSEISPTRQTRILSGGICWGWMLSRDRSRRYDLADAEGQNTVAATYEKDPSVARDSVGRMHYPLG